MKVVAVMPAYNEGDRAGTAVRACLPFVDAVIVVDDGSADRTADIARAAGATVIRHRVNRGQGAGLRTGTEAALRLGAEIIVHVDADGQHDPTFIPALVAPIMAGTADVAFGSRFLGVEAADMPIGRKILLQGARWFNGFALGIPASVTDPQSGFRAMGRQAAETVAFRQDRMAHCSEILRLVTHSPLRWTEVPIRVRYTADSLRKGQSSLDAFGIAWQLFVGVFAP